MSIVAQPKKTMMQHLADLEFISVGFSWFLLLLNRLAEPLMLVSTLYAIAEAGVPALSMAGLHLLATTILITSPEIILPGAFVLASQERAAGRPYKVLFGMCWAFVGLMVFTLASLFIFHFDTTWLSVLMWARCITSVSYSIYIRTRSHHGSIEQVQLTAQQTFEEKLEETVNQFNQRLEEVQKTVIEQVQSTLVEQSRQLVQEVWLDAPFVTIDEVRSVMTDELKPLVSGIEQSVNHRLSQFAAEFKRERLTEQPAALQLLPGRSGRHTGGTGEMKPVPVTPVESDHPDKPVQDRVTRFIQQEMNLGRKPSLSEIMNHCRCSKNTAIRYRRELLGELVGEETA